MEEENKTENISSKIKFLSDKLLDSKPQKILKEANKENSEPSLPIPLPRKKTLDSFCHIDLPYTSNGT